MIKHMTVITSRRGTTYNVYHHRNYVTGTCLLRRYDEHDNLPDSVLDVLIGIVPSTYDVQYVQDSNPEYGTLKIEHYVVPAKQYTIDYIVPTAMGNWTEIRRYKCKDAADFDRCVNLHFAGDVKILSVNGKANK